MWELPLTILLWTLVSPIVLIGIAAAVLMLAGIFWLIYNGVQSLWKKIRK